MNSKNNPISKSTKIKVGITIGDPSGIGPAITLKAINALKGAAEFLVIGDKWVLNHVSQAKSQNGAKRSLPEGDKSQVKIVDLNNVNHKKFSFGKIKAEYGKACIEYLDKAMELLRNNEIDCLVTAPVSKESIAKAGLRYGGHTEYFLKKAGVKEAVMMLLNDKLRFSLVTRHLPFKEVPAALATDKICNNILITYKSLKDLFGIRNPRLGICSLNPHASENGLFGKEEIKIIKPAVRKLSGRVKIEGPLSADLAIQRAFKGKYDCLIAMYHDQALIPLRLTGYERGVNITLGLPFIRTSPLHGTAFDIAKSPQKACPSSLISAIKLAIKCALNQLQ